MNKIKGKGVGSTLYRLLLHVHSCFYCMFIPASTACGAKATNPIPPVMIALMIAMNFFISYLS